MNPDNFRLNCVINRERKFLRDAAMIAEDPRVGAGGNGQCFNVIEERHPKVSAETCCLLFIEAKSIDQIICCARQDFDLHEVRRRTSTFASSHVINFAFPLASSSSRRRSSFSCQSGDGMLSLSSSDSQIASSSSQRCALVRRESSCLSSATLTKFPDSFPIRRHDAGPFNNLVDKAFVTFRG